MIIRIAGIILLMASIPSYLFADDVRPIHGEERQVTKGPGGRIITNTAVWSPDSQWIVYDVRSDPAGDIFDGSRIEMVHADTGEVKRLYQSVNGAHCGVALHHPKQPLIVFILGPEHPTPDWSYGPNHRQGVVLDTSGSGKLTRLDARDLIAPPTAGALRGGTHVHVWDAAGDWLEFTYNDALKEPGLRDIGVCIPDREVKVKPGHPRNHDGNWFTALVTQTVPAPRPGSDEIQRANEEGWIGTNGYVRADGTRQSRAIAFQGHVVSERGENVVEVFVVDLPDQLPVDTSALTQLTSDGRLRTLPGAAQRRLTRTTTRRYPGIQGTRHWLRSTPDGSMITCLMKDDDGVSQIFTVASAGGELTQLTRNKSDVSTAMSFSANGHWIAHGLNGQVCLTEVSTGTTRPVVGRQSPPPSAIKHEAGDLRKEACVISPDGCKIAFVRSRQEEAGTTNQICVIQLEQCLN